MKLSDTLEQVPSAEDLELCRRPEDPECGPAPEIIGADTLDCMLIEVEMPEVRV